MPSAMRKKFFRSTTADPVEGSSSSSAFDGDAAGMAVHQDSKGPTQVVDQPASEEQLPNEEAQAGVTQAEAITLTWTKSSLAIAYIL